MNMSGLNDELGRRSFVKAGLWATGGLVVASSVTAEAVEESDKVHITWEADLLPGAISLAFTTGCRANELSCFSTVFTIQYRHGASLQRVPTLRLRIVYILRVTLIVLNFQSVLTLPGSS